MNSVQKDQVISHRTRDAFGRCTGPRSYERRIRRRRISSRRRIPTCAVNDWFYAVAANSSLSGSAILVTFHLFLSWRNEEQRSLWMDRSRSGPFLPFMAIPAADAAATLLLLRFRGVDTPDQPQLKMAGIQSLPNRGVVFVFTCGRVYCGHFRQQGWSISHRYC